MNGHEQTNPEWRNDDCAILREIYWEQRCQLAEKLLKHVFTGKEIGRACHIHDLEKKIESLQLEITNQREAAEYRNCQLRATNLIISCDSGCESGVMGSKDNINEEMICEVERIAERLRSWWTSYQFRQRKS